MAITEYVTEPDRNHCADKVMTCVTIIHLFVFFIRFMQSWKYTINIGDRNEKKTQVQPYHILFYFITLFREVWH